MKPTLNTLSDAYIVLDELGLAPLLEGGKLEISVPALLSALLKERKLQRFLSIITGKPEAECGDLTPSQALEALTGFFTNFIEEMSSLPGFLAEILPATQTPKKPPKEA